MATLQETNNMKKRLIKGPTSVAPEQGGEHGPNTGGTRIPQSLAKKNAGIVKNPSIEKNVNLF
jgi:hypothetical protein